jgi:virginiamycin B lyase
LGEGASPWGIALGSDGQMWFTDQGLDEIGSFNTSTFVINEYSSGITPGDTYPRDIAQGPDGAMWFTEWGANKIGRIDPTTHAITEYSVPTSGAKPYGIVKDGSYMWFTECGTDKIGKIGPIQSSGGSARHRKPFGGHASAAVHLRERRVL